MCLKVTNFHPLRSKTLGDGCAHFKTVTLLFIYFLYKNIRKELSARTTSEKGFQQVELRFIARWGRVNRVTNYGLADFSHNQ